MAEEEFTILETNTSGSQPMPIRVLKVMHPNGSESGRARSAKLRRIARRGATPSRLPSRVVDPRRRSFATREHKLRMLATTAFDHGLRDAVQDHVAVQSVLHVCPWNDED
jgi:hypothetical protein